MRNFLGITKTNCQIYVCSDDAVEFESIVDDLRRELPDLCWVHWPGDTVPPAFRHLIPKVLVSDV